MQAGKGDFFMGIFPKIIVAIRQGTGRFASLLDSLSLSRHGESSDEHSSVMILDPMVGNSLEKATVIRTAKHHII